ncbi:efflux RND transporter periplasmic adaptor subunit [soil metagenome]
MKRASSIVFLLIALGACQKKPEPVFTPPVSFATARTEDIPMTIDTFGNCVTIADVTLQAQVTGNLVSYAVGQGASVKKGQLVASIDSSPYQAALETAQGNLDSARANLANMEVTLKRQQSLYQTKTIDLADLQTAQANELQAQGAVQTAEGQLADAQINVGYCTINSPVDGKTGLYLVDAGNLVTANNTKLLNIQTIDPIYVDFTISENDFDKVRQYFNSGDLQVQATIPGAPKNKIEGKLSIINNSISSNTGTLMLRATFPNADALLWPGLFVNIELVLAVVKDAIVIPSQCVSVGQKGPYIFVVNSDNTVAMRVIKIGERHSDETVVTDNLKAGEKVVTAGQLGLTTGKKVNPSLWIPPQPLVERGATPSPSPAAK